jgi:RsiW-degrading membrane proteinase PrsW (M82 family)
VFVTGLALWIASVVVTDVTGNPNLVPTVVLLGSFLVPVTAVIWYVDHDDSPTLTPRLMLDAFLVSGILGVLAASLLELWLHSGGLLAYAGVGLIEEFVKLAALALVAWHLPRYTVRDGIVLGAAVGFGFGALESSGYALTALFAQQGPGSALSLDNLVSTELVRGVVAPVGHGLWTAIVGGVLFGARRTAGRGRVPSLVGVAAAFLLVSLLHALWDAMRGIALVLTAFLPVTPAQRVAATLGLKLSLSLAQTSTFLSIEAGGMLLTALVGLLALRHLWRRAAQQPDE